MMINIADCISTLISLIFILKIISLSTEKISGCEVFKDNHGTMVAYCESTGIEKIPQDLGANTEVLDISNNDKIVTILNDDLKGYKKLWGLIMANLSLTKFPDGFFRHTPRLRMLNISNTQIKNLIEVPASIKVLNFTFSEFEYVNLSHLSNLEQLFLSKSSNMKIIPPIDKNAPLRVLDIKFASLIEANYTSLSPFCHLRYFGIHSDQLNEIKYNNRCCEFRKWCDRHRIRYGWQGQNCTNLENIHCRNLSTYFAEEALAAYNECFLITRKKVFLKVMAVLIMTSIIILVPSAFLLRRHYKKNISRIEEYKKSVPSKENVSTSENDGEAEADQDSND